MLIAVRSPGRRRRSAGGRGACHDRPVLATAQGVDERRPQRGRGGHGRTPPGTAATIAGGKCDGELRSSSCPSMEAARRPRSGRTTHWDRGPPRRERALDRVVLRYPVPVLLGVVDRGARRGSAGIRSAAAAAASRTPRRARDRLRPCRGGIVAPQLRQTGPTEPSSSCSTSRGRPTPVRDRPPGAASGSPPVHARRHPGGLLQYSSSITLAKHRDGARPPAREAAHRRVPRRAPRDRRAAGPRHRASLRSSVTSTASSPGDLPRGQAIAVAVALVALVAVFGLSLADGDPVPLRGLHDRRHAGSSWALAHTLSMVGYVTNLVELIGLALAIDSSLLIVHRLPRGARRGLSVAEAVAPHDGDGRPRSRPSPGFAVAAGLAVLLLLPVPFLRSIGIERAADPSVVSIAAALTLPQPVSVLAVRGTASPAEPQPGRLGALGTARRRDPAPPAALPRRRDSTCCSPSRPRRSRSSSPPGRSRPGAPRSRGRGSSCCGKVSAPVASRPPSSSSSRRARTDARPGGATAIERSAIGSSSTPRR